MSAAVLDYKPLGGDLHRHGDAPPHSHPHDGPHLHGEHSHSHGHTHGLVDPSIKRSRAGLRAVGLALAVLGATAAAQLLIFAMTGSVALLADLVHNFGDAATAIPLAIAFLLRSARAERDRRPARGRRDLRIGVRRGIRGDRPPPPPRGADRARRLSRPPGWSASRAT